MWCRAGHTEMKRDSRAMAPNVGAASKRITKAPRNEGCKPVSDGLRLRRSRGRREDRSPQHLETFRDSTPKDKTSR
jgi:hypothetical protein